MIKGLPDNFSSVVIKDFDFGSHEASKDELLEECFCDTAPVDLFLEGKKDFLVGVKGSGKSAVFKSLYKKRISFRNDNDMHQIIVAIDQDLEYLQIKSKIKSSLVSHIEDEDLRLRFVWEIFILYRIAVALVEEFPHLPKKLLKDLNGLISNFSGKQKDVGLLDIISGTTRSAGIEFKFSDDTGMPSADLYIKSEPSKNAGNTSVNPKEIEVNIADLQKDIHAFLRKNDSIVYVLIDNLDEFLARDAYDAQKLVIQGLLGAINNFPQHYFIKLKAFLRNEVFHKVEFEKIGGAEKVKPNAVYLEWTSIDIRKFLARRFVHNFGKIVSKNELSIDIEEDLYLIGIKPKICPLFIWRWYRKRQRSHVDVVDIPETDVAWRNIITSFMPREVDHYDSNGKKANGMDVFLYIDSHFGMANSKVTPRAILIFLDKLLQISSAYYSQRNYPNIELNEQGEYPLFLKAHMLSAYGALQKELIDYISSSVTHPEWKDRIASLLTNIYRKTEISFRDLKRLLDYDESDEDAQELLAFLEHLGVLNCQNKPVHLPDRRYSIPILLQKNWVREHGINGV